MSGPAIDLEGVRARVGELPALPGAVQKVLLALNDDDLGLDAIARRIAVDPAMVSRILRAANSPFYGVTGSVARVDDAIRLIGVRSVGLILTGSAVVKIMVPPSCPEFEFRDFWKHSLAVAICCGELAHECGASPQLAFVAGLLHDIGQLALATYYPEEYGAALRHARQRDCPLDEAERELLGLDHAGVGGLIAAHWHFAAPVMEAILRHHAPVGETSAFPPSLADIVHNADGIVRALDLCRSPAERVPLLDLAAWQRMNIAPARFARIFERTESALESMCQAIL